MYELILFLYSDGDHRMGSQGVNPMLRWAYGDDNKLQVVDPMVSGMLRSLLEKVLPAIR